MLGKSELLEAIAGKNRGILASKQDKIEILAAITQLEQHNPTPRPLEAMDKLNGDWRLLYTSSQGLLGFEQIPLVKLGQIYQCIRMLESKVYNLAEIGGLPFLEALISVEAHFEGISEKRVNVYFERSRFGLQRVMNYKSPSTWIEGLQSNFKPFSINVEIDPTRPPGWLDMTYLDDDLRIGRGNRGSVFVLTKMPQV